MENKKTKLTISGSPKKNFKNLEISKNQGKKTVFIDKSSNKSSKKGHSNKSYGSKPSFDSKKGFVNKSSNFTKSQSFTSDFEKRKLAEQRATKRLKADQENKEKKTKLSSKKEK